MLICDFKNVRRVFEKDHKTSTSHFKCKHVPIVIDIKNCLADICHLIFQKDLLNKKDLAITLLWEY